MTHHSTLGKVGAIKEKRKDYLLTLSHAIIITYVMALYTPSFGIEFSDIHANDLNRLGHDTLHLPD